MSKTQRVFLRAAERGVQQSNQWWQKKRHWYRSTLDGTQTASLWGVVPLFEALNAIQLAKPSHPHRHMLNRFARGAERYLNPSLEPVAGFGPKPRQRNPGKTTWFDDNGWWGLAFLDAYEATGRPRYLNDAMIADQFISVSGWDTTPGRPGGLWWNTNHSFYAGETLAGGTLLSARLYAITHDQHYLDDAVKYINWADVWLVDPATGLYARLRKPGSYGVGSGATAAAATTAQARDSAALERNPDEAAKLSAAAGDQGPQLLGNTEPPFVPLPMPYVQGPMILAHRIICEATGINSYCDRAEDLAQRTITVYQRFWMGPQYDRVYLHEMLELYKQDGNPDWYGMAASNAWRALRKAHDRHGLYLRTWYGKKPVNAGSSKGSLQLHAANTAVFAWMAAIGR